MKKLLVANRSEIAIRCFRAATELGGLTFTDEAKAALIGSADGDGRNGADTRPTRSQAEEAVKVLIRWAGDDPTREGLLDTPDRVVRS